VMGSTATVSDARVAEMDAVDPRAGCTDGDVDGVDDSADNCVDDFNPRQEDFNGDGEGEMCDADKVYLTDQTLRGANVVGGGDPTGYVHSYMSTNETDGVVCIGWSITDDLTFPVTGAHLHIGAAGANGDIVIIWNVVPGATRDAACQSADIGLIAEIKQDPAGYYLQVTNADYPDGAMRAQLGQLGT